MNSISRSGRGPRRIGSSRVRSMVWALVLCAQAAQAQQVPSVAPRARAAAPAVAPLPASSYADLADLVDVSGLVLRAQVRSQATVPAERAPGLRQGWARLYIEARVLALLAGRAPIGEDVHYLADVPLAANGRPPRLKGKPVLLFAREIPGKPGELQLAGPRAQMPADPALEARLRPILDQFFAADAPPRVTGVRDVLWVPGNLAGESETQLFLSTSGDSPALVSILRRPGQSPSWGVSWSELVDQQGGAPAHDTMVWYRLACFLPPHLPARAHLSRDPTARQQAEDDYQLVLSDLGPCARTGQ